ncbi:hypothetical protein [Desulfitobacterium dehalogenans]
MSENLGAELTASSAPNQNTTFSFRIKAIINQINNKCDKIPLEKCL